MLGHPMLKPGSAPVEIVGMMKEPLRRCLYSFYLGGAKAKYPNL